MNTNRYDKIKKLNLSKWIVTKFYRYGSWVNNQNFYEYDEVWNDKPIGDSYIKKLYYHFLNIVNFYVGYDLQDDKTIIEIKNIDTKETKYISFINGKYLYGNKIYTDFGLISTFGVIGETDLLLPYKKFKDL